MKQHLKTPLAIIHNKPEHERHHPESIIWHSLIYPSYFKLLRSAGVQAAESHSLSMLIDSLLFAPTSKSNYFGYIQYIFLINEKI